MESITSFSLFIFKAVEIDEDEDGTKKEQPVPIDHENFYDGRVFGELKSRAAVHMEVRIDSVFQIHGSFIKWHKDNNIKITSRYVRSSCISLYKDFSIFCGSHPIQDYEDDHDSRDKSLGKVVDPCLDFEFGQLSSVSFPVLILIQRINLVASLG